jgi:flavin reductase (DIM6/NTAB) family NADH-FMN oxidoreductase RutF
MPFRSYDPKTIPTPQLHEHLLGTIAPRPIAWASTVDAQGRVNLSPFSFFNIFSSNPPVLIFSPSRRVRDNTTKHTLENAKATGEVVINIANYELAGQMILSSGEFEEGINEFEQSNLVMEPSTLVKPPRVKESPAQFECRVRDIISLGENGGAGNLIICDIIYVHLSEHIFDEHGKVDPVRVDNIARMGRIWYTRAKEGLFEHPTPRGTKGIGFSRLPEHVRVSTHFTPSEMAKLASIDYMPGEAELEMVRESSGMQEIKDKYGNHKEEFNSKVHALAKTLIAENKLEEAWKVLMAFGRE